MEIDFDKWENGIEYYAPNANDSKREAEGRRWGNAKVELLYKSIPLRKKYHFETTVL